MSKLRECSLGQLQRMPGHQSSIPSNLKFHQSPNANQSTPPSPDSLSIFQPFQSLLSPSTRRPYSISPSSLPPSALSSTVCPPPTHPRSSTPNFHTPQPNPSAHIRRHGSSSQTSLEQPPPSTADISKSPCLYNSISKQRHTTSKVSKRPQPKQRNTTSKAPLSTSNTVFSKPKQRNSTSKTRHCPRQIKQNTPTHPPTHGLNTQVPIPHCSKVQQNSLPRANQQQPTTSTQSSHQTTIPTNQLIPNTPSNTSKRIR